MKKFNFILVALMSFAFINTNAQTSSLKVTSAGDVGIGTDTPDTKLQVVGDTKTEGAIIEKQGGSASVSCERIGSSAFAFGAGIQAGFTIDENHHLEFRSNTRTNVLDRKISTGNLLLRLEKLTGHAGFGGVGNPTTSIHTSGSITYNGSLFNASDERLKHNISDMNYGLKEVLQLNPISYQYNGKGGVRNVAGTQIGLKAQDLQKVAPEMVTTFTYEEENEETKVIDSEEYLMIDESAIKYMLINAIQEQQAIIERLEEELEIVKTQLNSKTGKTGNTQSIELNGDNLEKASLGQNAPNPFEGKTVINYFVPENTENASIVIFDITGKMIKEIDLETKGSAQIDLMMTNMPSGTYRYNLIVDGKMMDSKQMFIK